jgi:amino acid transporter
MSDDFEKMGVEHVEEEAAAPDGGLKRGLKNRHAQMISIGGVIGTGLFLGTAKYLAAAGPLGLLLGYGIVSSACVAVMLCLGELTTLLPVPGGQVTLAGRFVDPAMAFAMGWNYWYSWTITLPAELSAAAVLIDYWNQTINNAAWITILAVVVIVINFLGTRAFGECEFWFASIKVVTIVGLIILGIVIDLGGAPTHDRLGFRYWHNPGPLKQFDGIPGALGRFAGVWSVLIGAAYAFLGTEILGMTAAETRNPTKNIPIAIRGVWVRILLFYIIGVFVLGLICPSNDPRLVTGTGNAASSAWVIAVQRAGIKVLPSIANACFLTSACSAGSSDLYTSSRALYGLAKNGQAPKIFARTNSRGTPIYALALCAAFAALSYMGVSQSASTVFNWFSNMSAVSGMFNWFGICLTGIRFRQGLKAQGINPENLPWHSKFTPFAAWWGLTWSAIIILFADWEVFLSGNWDTGSFITNYIPIPFFFCMFFGYKLWHKTKWIPASEMDFVSGITSWKNQ